MELRNYGRLITTIPIQLSPLSLGTSLMMVPASKAPLCVHEGGITQSLHRMSKGGRKKYPQPAENWFPSVGPTVHSTVCPLLNPHPLCGGWFSLYLPPPTAQLLSPQVSAFLMYCLQRLSLSDCTSLPTPHSTTCLRPLIQHQSWALLSCSLLVYLNASIIDF